MSARYECGVCWWLYDPELGDPARQIAGGTPFSELPDTWTCPQCDTDKALFLALAAGGDALSENALAAKAEGDAANTVDPIVALRNDRLRALLDDYRDAMDREMAGLPIINPELDVAAVGFTPVGAGQLGMVITPWLLSAVWIPDVRDDHRRPPETILRRLPSGDYELAVVRMPRVGAFESLSLLSPVDVLTDMTVAREAAEAALAELLAPAPNEAPSRDAEKLTRRELLSGATEGG